MLFSGHTVNLTVCALSWHSYSRTAPLFYRSNASSSPTGPFASCVRYGDTLSEVLIWVIRILVWVTACVGYYLIIATHLHYTDDVVLALYLTFFLWFYYWKSLRVCHQQKSMVDKILFWVEKDAQDFDVQSGSEKEIKGLIDLGCWC